jgi:hypothetical protein
VHIKKATKWLEWLLRKQANQDPSVSLRFKVQERRMWELEVL